MRIATWNLEGKWSPAHADVLVALDADVLLLTEVRDDVVVPERELLLGSREMAPGRRLVGVAGRVAPRWLEDLHAASLLADVDGLRVCCSVLPARGWRPAEIYGPGGIGEMTAPIWSAVERARPGVWGGDFNQALVGREWVGTNSGRRHLLEVAAALGLQVPTAELPSATSGAGSVDHIAVPATWNVVSADRVPVPRRLSDHSAYVVEASPGAAHLGNGR